MSKFYEFSQNNSGGSFVVDDKVTQKVVIEAHDADHANVIAALVGIYFNGCESGADCPCCGDRWSPASDFYTEDTYKPSKPDDYTSRRFAKGTVVERCYFLDGTKYEVTL